MRVRMMIRAMLVVAATAMSLVALTACGGGSAQEQSNKPRPLPEKETALRPGEYRTGEYEPSLSFRVGKNWSLGGEAFQASLHLKRRDVSESGWLLFANVGQVYKPSTQGQWVDVPKDMVGWYQHHPYLQTTKPEPISVGGVKGVQFDVVVKDLPKDYYGECGSDCVDIIRAGRAGSGGHAWVWEKEKQRTIVLEDFRGTTVTIIYAFLAPEFDEMAPEAQRVIDSMKWRETA